MRSAASQPEDDPVPGRADLDAMAAQLLGGQIDLVTRAQALLARCPDSRTASLVRQLLVEVVSSGIHSEELRGELARYTAANAGLERAFAAGRAYERSLAESARKVPRQGRHAAGGHQSFILTRVKGIALVAAVAVTPHLRRAASLLKHSTAVKAVKASWVAAHPAAATAAGGVAVVSLAAAVTFAPPHSGSASAVPAASQVPMPGVDTSATPISSSSSPAAPAKPKAKHAAREKTLSAAGLPVPAYSAPPAVPTPSSSPSSSSAPAGPATITVGATAIDLSGGGVATFTVSASGSGWASWRISTAGTDLAFSPSQGVLQAGQQVTVTVSLAPAPDSLTQQSFSIAGQQVTVSLPLPSAVPTAVPSVVPTAVASVLPGI